MAEILEATLILVTGVCFRTFSQSVDIFLPADFKLDIGKKELESETVSDRDGTMEDKNVLVDDKKGNLVKEPDYDGENNVERRTMYYKYDDYGNWTVRVSQSFSGGGVTRIIRRNFSYKTVQ